MLAVKNRLTSREDFARTARSSIKASTESLTGYLLKSDHTTEPRVGFIVSRSLGGAVIRHQITRKLRHATRDSLNLLPDHSLVVVRARRSPDAFNEIPSLFQSLNQRSQKSVAHS